MSALEDVRWPELDAGTGVLAVPLGATEQHGPHLPLSTDTEIATALVAALAARVPQVVAAPALPYGASGEHQSFAGTLSIGTDATTTVLVELARSATATFPRVLFVSAHGGNADALRAAVALLRAESRDVRAWAPAWPGDAHAGETETSLMLAIAPGRVALERAQAGNVAPVGELMQTLREGGVRAASANGVLGDPAGASARRGRALLDEAAGALAEEVAAWVR